MACEDGPGLAEYFRQHDFMEGIACEYTGQLPLVAVGLLVFGAVASVAYIRTGSVVIPVGYVMLTGGVVIPLVAGPAVAIAVLLVLMAGGGIMAYLYWRFSP